MSGRLLLLMLCLCLALVAPASAQTPGPTQASTLAAIERDATEVESITAAVQTGTDTVLLQTYKQRLLEIQTSVTDAIGRVKPQLTELDARLAQLGASSEGEDRDIVESRRKLQAERSEIDSAVKRASLIEANTTQLLASINQTLADAFSRNVFENVGSPLSPLFWITAWQALPSDLAQVQRHFDNTREVWRENLTVSGIILIFASVLIAAALLGPARRYLMKIGFAVAKDRAPNTRLRRSGLATWLTIIGSLSCFLALTFVGAALRWSNLLPPTGSGDFTARLIGTLSFAGFVTSLGNALLLVDRSSWRLPSIDDDVSRLFRHVPAVAAVLLAIGVILFDVTRVLVLTPSATALSNLGVTSCYCLLFGWILFSFRKLRKQRTGEDEKRERVSPLLLAGGLLLQVALLITVVSAASGYLNLSVFLGRGLVWIAIIATATYLLLLVIDDLCLAIGTAEGPVAVMFQSALGVRPGLVEQTGILVSAVLRIALAFLALICVFVPFGPGTGDLFAGVGDLTSFTIAGITFEPGSLFRSMLVLVVSVAIVRLALDWLDGTYLPATNLDAGARNSVLMIVKYAGFILAGLWTVNTLGIGMERIALVVSALSVGIGFGLQAITQNFISGLILLAERPLKIGDTIRLGDDEGDVKKISVRSTEIQISDRSTLIVPNSELITKTIRNMTPNEPVGRVHIAFSVPIDVNPVEVRQLMTRIYEDHPGILDEPKPSVLIDSISDGKIKFDSFAFVGSPRAAAATKSALFFTLIERFRAADISLHTT